MMKLLLTCGADEFIDFENKTASFDNGMFEDLLEYLNDIPTTRKVSSDVEPYRKNEIILSNDTIYNFTDYIKIFAKYGFDSDVTFVGYPSSSGGIGKIIPRMYCGISSDSENINGAWEFIKFMMSGANLLDTEKGMQYIPSYRKTLNDWLSVEGEIYYFFSYETGRFRGSDVPFTDEEMLKNGTVIRPNEKLFSEFDEFINNMVSKPELPSSIMEIINEESELYFAGIKSAKDTAEIIQDRVSVYLSESM